MEVNRDIPLAATIGQVCGAFAALVYSFGPHYILRNLMGGAAIEPVTSYLPCAIFGATFFALLESLIIAPRWRLLVGLFYGGLAGMILGGLDYGFDLYLGMLGGMVFSSLTFIDIKGWTSKLILVVITSFIVYHFATWVMDDRWAYVLRADYGIDMCLTLEMTFISGLIAAKLLSFITHFSGLSAIQARGIIFGFMGGIIFSFLYVTGIWPPRLLYTCILRA